MIEFSTMFLISATLVITNPPFIMAMPDSIVHYDFKHFLTIDKVPVCPDGQHVVIGIARSERAISISCADGEGP